MPGPELLSSRVSGTVVVEVVVVVDDVDDVVVEVGAAIWVDSCEFGGIVEVVVVVGDVVMDCGAAVVAG